MPEARTLSIAGFLLCDKILKNTKNGHIMQETKGAWDWINGNSSAIGVCIAVFGAFLAVIRWIYRGELLKKRVQDLEAEAAKHEKDISAHRDKIQELDALTARLSEVVRLRAREDRAEFELDVIEELGAAKAALRIERERIKELSYRLEQNEQRDC